MGGDISPRHGGTRRRDGTNEVQTTLLDLLMGIDEVADSEQESLAAAMQLLRCGRVRVISRSSELAGAGLLSRARLRDLIEEEVR